MVEINLETEKLTCSFSGALDTDKCQSFENEVCEKVRASKLPVVFDLKNVDYISSAFLGICIMISKEVGAENFSILNVGPAMKRVFKIAKLDTILNVS